MEGVSTLRSGHIKHYRKEMQSYVWSLKPEHYKVWQTILLTVNWQGNEHEFNGEIRTIEPGQTITGYEDLAKKSGRGVSVQNVRTALDKFEEAEMITREVTNKGTLLTVVNWDKYQKTPGDGNNQSNKQVTSNQQATNKPVTTNEEVNKERKEENKNINEVFEHWQDCGGTITHRNKQSHKNAVRARLNDGFTVSELKTAIDRLEKLYSGKINTWLTTEWTCKEFMSRKSGGHVEKMLENFDHFKKDGGNNGRTGKPTSANVGRTG